MKKSDLITQDAAAKLLTLSPRTLEKLRVNGGGPPYFKLGSRIAYSVEDLEAWLDVRRRLSTSDPDDLTTEGCGSGR